MPKILSLAIVDDDPIYRKILSLLLKKNDFNILFEAENGAEGIRLMKNTALPDLIILDLEMPVMDGFETARLLKLSWPQVKIIGHSSISDLSAKHKMIEAGADYYIVKGDRNVNIATKIKQILSKN